MLSHDSLETSQDISPSYSEEQPVILNSSPKGNVLQLSKLGVHNLFGFPPKSPALHKEAREKLTGIVINRFLNLGHVFCNWDKPTNFPSM